MQLRWEYEDPVWALKDDTHGNRVTGSSLNRALVTPVGNGEWRIEIWKIPADDPNVFAGHWVQHSVLPANHEEAKALAVALVRMGE